jgi:aminobenzoyl-glutamate utilization protein B
MVAQGKTSYAHKGMLQAGKVMAAAAARCLQDSELIGRARQEHVRELGGAAYKPLIPLETKPMKVR